MSELRDACRRLRATPLVTAVAVLSLALGIGANAAIFSLLNAALLRPLPIENPHRLVIVGSADLRSAWPQSVFAFVRDHDVLPGSFAWVWSRLDTSTRGERQFVDGIAASGGMFASLGIRPAVGRLLTPADDRLDAGPDGLAAVISDRFWQRRFGRAADVLGQSITLDRRSYTIVGVLPRGFVGLNVGLPLDVVIPLGPPSPDPGSPYVTIMARLRDGETPATASAMLRSLQPQIREATNPYSVSPYREEYLRQPFTVRSAPAGVSFLERRYGQPMKILFGIVALVLFIACGNVAMLLLARAAARRRELGVRVALGATRSRLVWQLSTEGILIALLGLLLGVMFAEWGARVVVASLATQAYTVFLDLRPDWRVFAFTSMVGVVTAVLFSVAPALRVTRIDVMDALTRRHVEPFHRFRFGNAIVVGQVALSLVLLVGTGLFLRTFWVLASIDVGFEPDRVLVAAVDAPDTQSDQGRARLDARLIAALDAMPGATRVAASLTMPGGTSASTPWIELSDGTALPQGPNGVYANRVSAGWFETLGTRILTGRSFDATDTAGSPRVTIVNQAFAERFFETGTPLGRTIVHRSRPGDTREPLEIVGVVENAMYRFVKEPAPPTIYTPLAQLADPLPATIYLSIRIDRMTETLTRDVTGKILSVDRDASVTFRTLSDQISAQYAQERLVASMATIFGALAVLLAAIGLYGLAAYAVVRRRDEIGIRLALGAAPASIVRLMLGRVVALTASGVLIGMAASISMTRFVGSLLYGVEPDDIVTLAGACTLLAAVAMLAAWLPTRHAARIDPSSVLGDGPR